MERYFPIEQIETPMKTKDAFTNQDNTKEIKIANHKTKHDCKCC